MKHDAAELSPRRMTDRQVAPSKSKQTDHESNHVMTRSVDGERAPTAEGFQHLEDPLRSADPFDEQAILFQAHLAGSLSVSMAPTCDLSQWGYVRGEYRQRDCLAT